MNILFKSCFSVILAIMVLSANDVSAQPIVPKTFEKGVQAPFLGLFTHTEPTLGMDNKIQNVKSVIAKNPYISGITIKIWWKDFHPEKNKIEWEKLEELITIISSSGKLVNLAIWGGYYSPDWVYNEGCAKVEGPLGSTIVPWDPKYMELFSADIKAIAAKYANDRRIFMVGVLGHNFKGEEMHAPPVEIFKDYNWSESKVFENWKYWIDLYNSLYPNKKLSIVISQMYPGKNDLPEKVVSYFLEKCSGRAVLQTHQLNGREAIRSMSICEKYSNITPNCHEMVGSFKEQPERQGTPEMTIYNFKQMGNPLYLQLWRRDCEDPQYAKALLEAWEKYKRMTMSEMKEQLIKEGLYIEKSTWNMQEFLKKKN
jgi:hypothetical protein